MSKKVSELRSINKRIFIFSILKLFGLCAIFSRLSYLQVFNREKYTTLSDGNRIKLLIEAPERGRIFDTNGQVLAEDIFHETIIIESDVVRNFNYTIDVISKILGFSEQQRASLLKKRKKKIITLDVPVDWHRITEITHHIPDLKGIRVASVNNRTYPLSETFAHITGYTKITDSNLPIINNSKLTAGVLGIEKARDKILAGNPGIIKLESNAFGNTVREIERTPSVRGQDTFITVDAQLQKYASELFTGLSGALVLIENASGRILTLHSSPSYDPNKFVEKISEEAWQRINSDSSAPMFNRAVAQLTPPASTFKLVIALSALSRKVIVPSTTYNCEGYLKVGNRDFHCLRMHGHCDLQRAIAASCNVFFYNVAKNLDIDYTTSIANKLGLGVNLDFELPAEKNSMVPTTRWKQKTHHARWQTGDSMNYSIGQGYILLTPLQLATMASRLATRKKILPTLSIATQSNFEDLDIDSSALDVVHAAMIATMNEYYGTGYHASTSNKVNFIAGKTGTAQLVSVRKGAKENSLFVGYAPYNNPKYSISVMVENAISKSTKAAFIGSKMLKFALS